MIAKERDADRRPELFVSTILDDYWREHVAARVIDKDRIELASAHLNAYFGAMRPPEIDAVAVQGFVSRRRAGRITWTDEEGRERGGRQAGDGTIRRELGCLIAAINHAVRNRRLPATDVPHIAMPEAPDPKDRWLTPDEATRLLRAAQRRGWRIHAFCLIALETAARRRAIEALTWFQVDLERGLINFNPEGRRQTKKRRARVPISRRLMPVLQEARKRATEEKSEYVLGCDGGSIRKAFEGLVAEVGLDDVTPHTLRHTWATWAAQDGVALWDIAGVLGDTVDTVTRRYMHHCPEHLRRAVDRGEDAPCQTVDIEQHEV